MFPIKTTIHDDGTVATLYEGAPSDDAAFRLEAQGPIDGVLKPMFEPIIAIMQEEKQIMKYFEKQALLNEFSYATEDGSVLTYKDIEAILDHFDDGSVPVIELLRQEDTDGLKRKYIVLKSDTGEPVEECFVLRPDKDKAAIAGLLAYAEATENQVLAADIRKWLSIIIPAEEG